METSRAMRSSRRPDAPAYDRRERSVNGKDCRGARRRPVDSSVPPWYRGSLPDIHGRPTVAEVSLAALRHNCRRVRELVGPGVAVLAVVKADAYGRIWLRRGAPGLEVGRGSRVESRRQPLARLAGGHRSRCPESPPRPQQRPTDGLGRAPARCAGDQGVLHLGFVIGTTSALRRRYVIRWGRVFRQLHADKFVYAVIGIDDSNCAIFSAAEERAAILR